MRSVTKYKRKICFSAAVQKYPHPSYYLIFPFTLINILHIGMYTNGWYNTSFNREEFFYFLCTVFLPFIKHTNIFLFTYMHQPTKNPWQRFKHCAYQVTLTQIFKNLTKILPLLGGKSYLIQTQISDLAKKIKGENFN